jgi:hypothetical protein
VRQHRDILTTKACQPRYTRHANEQRRKWIRTGSRKQGRKLKKQNGEIIANHCESLFSPLHSGAAEESRTLDLNLGKVALYQLSYCRFVLYLEARAGVEPTYTDLQSGA